MGVDKKVPIFFNVNGKNGNALLSSSVIQRAELLDLHELMKCSDF